MVYVPHLFLSALLAALLALFPCSAALAASQPAKQAEQIQAVWPIPALAAPKTAQVSPSSSADSAVSTSVKDKKTVAVAPSPEAGKKQTSSDTQKAEAAHARGDFLKARDIWQKLAREGDSTAMNSLGLLYDRGQGVEPDEGRALHWFARAAHAGDPAGMSNYGRLLEQKDPMEAARWLDMAARRGSPEAQYNLGMFYEHGRGVLQNDSTAAAWYSRAAALQQTEALARLGHFYRIGRGVEKNSARAALLLYAAAMQGNESAIEELKDMAKEGPERPAAVLFGRRLDDTDRPTMRVALRKAHVAVKREKNSYICDLYDVHKAVPGASEMALCYGPGKAAPLGFVKIDYPAPDKDSNARILRMAEERFGPPSAGEGEDARLWNLGSVVVATQHMPEQKQISLMYMVPGVYHKTQRP